MCALTYLILSALLAEGTESRHTLVDPSSLKHLIPWLHNLGNNLVDIFLFTKMYWLRFSVSIVTGFD
jgi:hypothetical protein